MTKEFVDSTLVHTDTSAQSEPVQLTGSPTPIQVGTHFFRQRYLFAFATQAELRQYLRTQSSDTVASHHADIMDAWVALQPRIADLMQTEAGLAETIELAEIPSEHEATVEQYASDPLFEKTFSSLPTGFGIVEIDKLIAGQRAVNLDYVERIVAGLPPNPSMADLLQICLSPKRSMDPIQHLEVAGQAVHIFSSPNSDVRFLGAFLKPLEAADVEYAVMGGIPAAAVIAFVGYGAAPVNVLRVGQRVLLNNGFHRVHALRSLGVNRIPVVVQDVRNVALECPPMIADLPREYLLGVPRPGLMKDFFEPDFAITLQVKERIKTVTLAVNAGQHFVPA